MPALISYKTKRGTVYYIPPHSPSAETDIARLPTPPYRPRTRRPHSIQIVRLPSSNTPSSSRRPSKRIDLKKIKSCKSAKRALKSVIASLTPKPSTKPNSTVPFSTGSSETSLNYRPAQTRLTITALSSPNGDTQRTGTTSAMSIMSRSSIGDSYWRSTFNAENTTPRNSISISSPRSSMTGVSSSINTNRVISESEKPLASGNGVSCSIFLAEPVIFLMGLDNDGTTRDSNGANATAILRGTLRLNITKNSKIKAVSLKFTGRAKTIWPEGIPPLKQETIEECSLRTQVIPFFNAAHNGSDSSYGDLCSYSLCDSKLTAPTVTNINTESLTSPQQSGFSFSGITNRVTRHNSTSQVSEGRRSSAPSVQSNTNQKGDSSCGSTQSKGYKIFYPGVYDYLFELPIDNNMPETTNLPLASVKWELEATIERAGTFKTNLVGRKEVPVVRSPSQDSLELVEPIAVSRTWDQQLHYDIVISGKSFPIGTKIPIAFKLTPLAKVQVHKVKVFLTENIDYFAKGKSVQRKDVKRKMLLLEKSAGKPISKEFWPSEVKIVGGECPAEGRKMRRSIAMRRREVEAQRNNTIPLPLPESVDNLLGDIDLGVEEWWGPTEIEMNVQLPTCETMSKDRSKRLAHDCTWKNVHVHHWIKIIIRLSRADVNDPSKRRHYEISVDSPISLLNCRASQANISLPEYSGPSNDMQGVQQVCGCTNVSQTTGLTALQTTLIETSPVVQQSNSDASFSDLTRPPQAHLSSNTALDVRRPMHLVRSPSFLPPPFDAEEPPPPAATPPPLYDNVIGTPSHDGLADYFMRLGEYEGELMDYEHSIRALSRSCVNASTNSCVHNERLARIIDMNRDCGFSSTAPNSIMSRIESGVSTP
ncbi:arrestin domain-containing protein [Golovinomyces cichoracearum]|uniref:Arrestin domain-containing protein n=1 Tax=Golovinomyces cichoracearum TaxID=62708 RepID=A0A420JA96_9PEZI|nr:arrestin domain-containing protein [Golovinomyces cichoracearum]